MDIITGSRAPPSHLMLSEFVPCPVFWGLKFRADQRWEDCVQRHALSDA